MSEKKVYQPKDTTKKYQVKVKSQPESQSVEETKSILT